LTVVEDGELGRREVKTLACLVDEITDVEVRLAEVWRGGLSRRSTGGSRREGERGEVIHRDDGGSGTRSLKGG